MTARPVLRPTFTPLANAVTTYLTPSYTSMEPVCPWRPLNPVQIDGTAYFANGWNRSFYADIVEGKLYPLGSIAPATFVVTDAAGGSSMPAGATRFYYFAFRNDNRAEETAPQLDADGVAGYEYTMVATKDRDITWEDPGDGRWTHAAIYVRRPLSDDIVKLAYVPIETETYTDTTPDNDLSTAITDTYVPRYRTDYPPRFKAFSEHMGRVLAITGKDAVLYFSQQVHPTGELLQTDFPAGNLLAIDPDDGLGELTAVFAHYDATILAKRRGAYLFEGDSPDTFTWRRLYQGRGMASARAWCAVNSSLIMYDEIGGMYAWSPGAEPQVIGNKGTGVAESPLAPTWQRVNRDALDFIHLHHKEFEGYVEACLPMDRAPIATDRARWNFRDNRFESVDDAVSLAAGPLEDSSGVEHHVRQDDLGFVLEEDVGVSGGVQSGSIHSDTLNPASQPGEIATPATAYNPEPLLGPHGTILERRDADGVLLDSNRVLDANPNVLTLLYYSPVALHTPQTIDVGCIPADVTFAQWDMGTADRKTMPRCIPRFRPGTAWNGVSPTTYPVFGSSGLTPTLNVFSAADERAFALRRAVDMTGAKGWASVPCWDRGYRVTVRFEAHRAGDYFLVQAMTLDVWATRVRV